MILGQHGNIDPRQRAATHTSHLSSLIWLSQLGSACNFHCISDPSSVLGGLTIVVIL